MVMHELETARVRLRLFTPEDLDALSQIFSKPTVLRYLGKQGDPMTREETETALLSMISHWRRHGFGRWAVVDKETETLIGCAGLRSFEGVGELVYLLDEPFWGVGLATEIARACLRYAFEVQQMNHVIGLIKLQNLASRRVMEKIGMSFEMERILFDIEVAQYKLTRAEYQSEKFLFIVHEAGEKTVEANRQEN